MSENEESKTYFAAYAVGCMESGLGGEPGYSVSAYIIHGLAGYDDPANPQMFFSSEPTHRVWEATIMAIVGIVECLALPDGSSVCCLIRYPELANAYKRNFLRSFGTPMANAAQGERLLAIRDRRGIALTVGSVMASNVPEPLRLLKKTAQKAVDAYASEARKLPPFPTS